VILEGSYGTPDGAIGGWLQVGGIPTYTGIITYLAVVSFPSSMHHASFFICQESLAPHATSYTLENTSHACTNIPRFLFVALCFGTSIPFYLFSESMTTVGLCID
jgi:hypothetical protein